MLSLPCPEASFLSQYRWLLEFGLLLVIISHLDLLALKISSTPKFGIVLFSLHQQHSILGHKSDDAYK